MGPPLLRQLARFPQMAAPQTLRSLRQDDRTELGRHRRLLQTGEQGLSWFRRGSEQQDPRYPEKGLRPARRGLLAAQGPHLHASGALTEACMVSYRLFAHSIPRRAIKRIEVYEPVSENSPSAPGFAVHTLGEQTPSVG